MPRQQRRAAAAPARPSVAPQRPAGMTPPQQRPASTSAYPPAAQHAPPPPAPAAAQPQASAGPGLFGQMASTAAGVAVGSSIGHAIGGFFSGGSSSAPPETQQAAAPAQSMDQGLYQTNSWSSTGSEPKVCDVDIKNFTKCMDENQGNMTICGWYLDQLKACQAAASKY